MPSVAQLSGTFDPSLFSGFTVGGTFWANVLSQSRHTMKFGGEFEYAQFNQRLFFPPNFGFFGSETGSDIADFLLGAPGSFFEISPDLGDGRTHYISLYAQDSWRMRPNLTLNYGLRWEVSQPWYDTRDRVSTYIAGEQPRGLSDCAQGLRFRRRPGCK